ncbi:MAG TPA: hypothetical protein DD979_05015 [Gammaproteobacteria bacterium]|jgi:hypothetical protein|nr:hypothetical protein [Gammaproteobacteria bacterium]
MLSLIDCLGLCDLTEEEVEAIATHEHVPDVVAVELAEYLIHSPDGVPMIRRIILDDIEEAEKHGHTQEADKLRLVLKRFIVTHPEYAPQEPA